MRRPLSVMRTSQEAKWDARGDICVFHALDKDIKAASDFMCLKRLATFRVGTCKKQIQRSHSVREKQ